MTTMMPFIDQMLMRYAAGNLNTSEALVVAAHIALNGAARRRVAHYEALGGKVMQEVAPAPVHKDCLDAVLRRIEGCPPCAEKAQPVPRPASEEASPLSIPTTVMVLLEGHCNEKTLCWTEKSGFEVVDLSPCTPNPCTLKLFLLRLHPNQPTLPHGHTGMEITVVLAGSYRDETGTYKSGDITVITDSSLTHMPVAGPEGCLCLILVSGPLKFQ